MVNYKSNPKLELDDNEVLFPNQEEYETDDKEMLISRLKDKDKLIEKLWFELKGTREQEYLWKKHASEVERTTTTQGKVIVLNRKTNQDTDWVFVGVFTSDSNVKAYKEMVVAQNPKLYKDCSWLHRIVYLNDVRE